MDINNCTVGMEIKKVKKSITNIVEVGDVVEIKEIFSGIMVSNLEVETKNGKRFTTSSRYYEPINKFEVGDEVIYYNGNFKIWGVIYNDEVKQYNYALINDNDEVTIAFKSQISPLKKKDELEVGDKFKVKTAEGVSKRINEVLGVFKDDYYNQTKYVAKRLNGNYKGLVDIYNSEMIAEII